MAKLVSSYVFIQVNASPTKKQVKKFFLIEKNFLQIENFLFSNRFYLSLLKFNRKHR